MYRQTVVRLNRDKYKKASDTLLGLVLGEKFLYASFNNAYYNCKTCDCALSRGSMPIQSVANNLELSSVPPELSCLNRFETRLICLRVAFMTLVALPAGKQRCIHGPAVNIPVKISSVITTTTLPRLPDDAQLIPLKFKQKLSYKGHYMYDFITPEKILDDLRWLNLHHPQYANVTVNDKWSEESQKQNLTCMLV